MASVDRSGIGKETLPVGRHDAVMISSHSDLLSGRCGFLLMAHYDSRLNAQLAKVDRRQMPPSFEFQLSPGCHG